MISHDIIEHFSNPLPRPANEPFNYDRGCFETRTRLINTTGQDITVGYRNGLKVTIPSDIQGNNHTFVVRIEIAVPKGIVSDLHNTLNKARSNEIVALGLMRDEMGRSVREKNIYDRNTILTLDYPISVNELLHKNNSVYYHDIDLVVSLDPPELVPPHPESWEGRAKRLDMPEYDQSDAKLHYSIKVIDNTGLRSRFYTTIGSVVYMVPVVMGKGQENGIYIQRPIPVDTGTNGNIKPKLERYDFDETEVLEALGIYSNYDDALNRGDVASVRKRQLVDKEQQTKLLDHQYKNDRLEREREGWKDELERLQMQIEHERENHRHEMQKMERKDYYEERSYYRKDSSEMAKYLPTVIMSVGAIVVALSGLFSKKDK